MYPKNNSDYDQVIKLLLIGDNSVGKTSLFLRYTDNIYKNSLISTIGIDLKFKKIVIDEKIIKLQIWDTAGHEKFGNMTSSYYRGAHCVILMYDITSEKSFQNINHWITTVYKNASPSVQIVLVGNKYDLHDERCIEEQTGKDLADQFNIHFFEASAKTGMNIEDIFVLITKEYLKNIVPQNISAESLILCADSQIQQSTYKNCYCNNSSDIQSK